MNTTTTNAAAVASIAEDARRRAASYAGMPYGISPSIAASMAAEDAGLPPEGRDAAARAAEDRPGSYPPVPGWEYRGGGAYRPISGREPTPQERERLEEALRVVGGYPYDVRRGLEYLHSEVLWWVYD